MTSPADVLRRGYTLPQLGLQTPAGEPFDLRAYRGRANLVLFVLPRAGNAGGLLREVARRQADFEREETRCLVVLEGPATAALALASQDGLTFPVLPDASGDVLRTLGAAVPTVIITDRYGEIYEAWAEQQLSVLPTADDLLEWARFISMQCEECFPPEWPAV